MDLVTTMLIVVAQTLTSSPRPLSSPGVYQFISYRDIVSIVCYERFKRPQYCNSLNYDSVGYTKMQNGCFTSRNPPQRKHLGALLSLLNKVDKNVECAGHVSSGRLTRSRSKSKDAVERYALGLPQEMGPILQRHEPISEDDSELAHGLSDPSALAKLPSF
ncbi:hypothetical protein RhiJN_12308 [Ceratobasidium sp. AG-Ba]|nr:hypothetical protein RhiJN_12308 [Ceratobasidium sp. AG-Ba]